MFAPSHRSIAVRGAGEVASQAERLKHSKYTALEAKFHFVLVAVETSGVFGPEGVFGSEAHEFLHELGSRMARVLLDPMSIQFLIQRISVVVQRGNAAAVLGKLQGTLLLMFYLCMGHRNDDNGFNNNVMTCFVLCCM